MAQKRSKLAKIFVYLALAAVCIGVIAPFITYFWVEYFDWNKCDEWYIRNEETQQCEEEIIEEVWENIEENTEENIEEDTDEINEEKIEETVEEKVIE